MNLFINENVSEPTKRQNTEQLKNFQKNASLIYINKECGKMKENDDHNTLQDGLEE